MNRRAVLSTTVALLAAVLLAGCASTKITSRDELVTGKLSRPAHIWVYDFVATPADVPADSALAGQYAEHTTPQTAEQIATGREVGAEIAAKLVEESAPWECPQSARSRERHRRSATL